MPNKSDKTLIKVDTQDVFSKELCIKIRERLKLSEKELPDNLIRKITCLNNRLIGKWIIENSDGYRIKNFGIIIVSKFMPKFLKGNKEEEIEVIMKDPRLPEWLKRRMVKRYENKLKPDFQKEKPSMFTNIASFFYSYKIMWFNSRNCKNKKAEIYEFEATKSLKQELNEKILSGKEYFSWQFSDFRLRKRDKVKTLKKY